MCEQWIECFSITLRILELPINARRSFPLRNALDTFNAMGPWCDILRFLSLGVNTVKANLKKVRYVILCVQCRANMSLPHRCLCEGTPLLCFFVDSVLLTVHTVGSTGSKHEAPRHYSVGLVYRGTQIHGKVYGTELERALNTVQCTLSLTVAL